MVDLNPVVPSKFCLITFMAIENHNGSFLDLGHTHYILRLTDPDRGIPGLSERKK